MKISVIGPVLNEVDFIGYSIMACLDNVHEFIYSLDEDSNDGTRELLEHIKKKYAHDKLKVLTTPNFHPSDQKAYNDAFNIGIQAMTGDAAWFLHPDMIVTRWDIPREGPLAWSVNVKSFAGDFTTKITKGRVTKWKNLHAKKFGLHYFGGYGSQNEDFYHRDITGTAYKHYGTDFAKYPFEVEDSGIEVNHYCELKGYKRRLEKMKACLRTLLPQAKQEDIDEMAKNHPRVTLEPTSQRFGTFEFSRSEDSIPWVFNRYGDEFSGFKKEVSLV